MSKRKKHQHHEEHVDETWLIPYADLLTLLLALFIVLFSMSSIDAQKFASMQQSFNQTFSGGTGIFEYPSPLPSGEMQSPDEQEKDDDKMKEQRSDDQKEAEEKADQEELKTIQNKINTYISDNKLSATFETSLTTEGLLVSIRDNVLFNSGSAEIRNEDVKVAQEIAKLLIMDPPRNIIISGHTDNVPIRNANFSSNWELSVMRAVNFMKIMLKNKELDPRWFSAKGFGEFQPIAPNDVKEGRSKNRRVEIMILPRTSITTTP